MPGRIFQIIRLAAVARHPPLHVAVEFLSFRQNRLRCEDDIRGFGRKFATNV